MPINITIIGAGNLGTYTGSALQKAYRRDQVRLTYFDPYVLHEQLKDTLRGTKFRYVPADSNFSTIVGDAHYVLLCVPTDQVQKTLEKVLPHCKAGTIISTQTSRKSDEAKTIDDYFSKNPSCGLHYAPLHTMCNPRLSIPEAQNFAIIRHKGPSYETPSEVVAQVTGFYGKLSPKHTVTFESIKEHDDATANTQVLTSINFLSAASTYAEQGRFPWLENKFGNPIDTMLFALAMRAASQEAHIYRGIQYHSNHGNTIVAKSMNMESALYGMKEGARKDDFRDTLSWAKDQVFGSERTAPILSRNQITRFNGQEEIPNSHYFILQWVAGLAANNINPFKDLRAKTPMYTSLLCLADYVFNAEGELDKAIDAFFETKSNGSASRFREEDFIFHDNLRTWSLGMLNDSVTIYNRQYEKMRKKISQQVLDLVHRSRDVVGTCESALERAIRKKIITIG